jgi:hypothetical protein
MLPIKLLTFSSGIFVLQIWSLILHQKIHKISHLSPTKSTSPSGAQTNSSLKELRKSKELNFTPIRTRRRLSHPSRSRRNQKPHQLRNLLGLPKPLNPRLLRKLLHRFLNTHLMRWSPFLQICPSTIRHDGAKKHIADLHSIHNPTVRERFCERDNSGVDCSDSCVRCLGRHC